MCTETGFMRAFPELDPLGGPDGDEAICRESRLRGD